MSNLNMQTGYATRSQAERKQMSRGQNHPINHLQRLRVQKRNQDLHRAVSRETEKQHWFCSVVCEVDPCGTTCLCIISFYLEQCWFQNSTLKINVYIDHTLSFFLSPKNSLSREHIFPHEMYIFFQQKWYFLHSCELFSFYKSQALHKRKKL